ncbi:MAG: formylglycine-generating enzyme family protein [Bradymonadaceae bacterium]
MRFMSFLVVASLLVACSDDTDRQAGQSPDLRTEFGEDTSPAPPEDVGGDSDTTEDISEMIADVADVVPEPDSSPDGGEPHLPPPPFGDDWISIPGGSFEMGCEDAPCHADEAPVHTVILSPYFILRTEVSRGAYLQCVDDGTCGNPTSDEYDGEDDLDLPATGLAWDQAEVYCQWISARLPTEAEWERACTGGDGRTYPWGEEEPTCEFANTDGCGGKMAVDSLEAGAGPEGVLHMAGNVWEWVADWYADDAYAHHEPTNPGGPETGEKRVYRGGSAGNLSNLARCQNRASSYNPNYGGTGLGFRCVYDGK